MQEKMFAKIATHTVFIYLTEKCNLHCDYCYFRDKRGRTLNFPTVKKFLNHLGSAGPKYFELSGGEPLLFWPLVKKTALYLKTKFKRSGIGIQTNGLLLDDSKISFIEDNGIMLELGIDGSLWSTVAHRKRMAKGKFDLLIKNIEKCLKKEIDLSCTMTVHPEEVSRLQENFSFLKGLGVKSIDITPAAFMSWDPDRARLFKQKYSGIVKNEENRRYLFTAEDRELLPRGVMDLSLHPPGYVFCGDAYLCLPEAIRRTYTLMNLEQKDSCANQVLVFYLKSYKKHLDRLDGGATYRDYISAGFKIIDTLSGKNYLNTGIMVDFHNFLKKTHRKFF